MDNLTILSDEELIHKYRMLTPLEQELLRRYNNMKAKVEEQELELNIALNILNFKDENEAA